MPQTTYTSGMPGVHTIRRSERGHLRFSPLRLARRPHLEVDDISISKRTFPRTPDSFRSIVLLSACFRACTRARVAYSACGCVRARASVRACVCSSFSFFASSTFPGIIWRHSIGPRGRRCDDGSRHGFGLRRFRLQVSSYIYQTIRNKI